MARYKNSLTLKFIVVVGGLLLTTQLLFTAYQIYQTAQDQARDLHNKVLAQARFVGAVSHDNILSSNFYPLENLMRETSQDSEILYSYIVQNDGQNITNYLDTADPKIASAITTSGSYNIIDIVEALSEDRNVVEIREPIVAEQLLVGEIHIGYSIEGLRARITRYMWNTLFQAIIVGLLLAFATIFLFNRQIRTPLHRLGLSASAFAQGKFDLRVPVKGEDEINQLHKAFNKMADQVQTTLTDLKRVSRVASETKNLVIITDPKGHIEWANEAYERISGYSAEACIGRRPGELLQGPKSDPDTIAYMRSQLAKNEGFQVEIINYTKSGCEYWVSIEVEPIYDEGKLINFIAIETDITEKKQNDKLIESNRLRKGAILSASLDGIITSNSKGEIIEFNMAAEQIFGHLESDILGSSFNTLLDDHVVFQAETAQEPAVPSSINLGQRIETHGYHADQRKIPIEIAVVPVHLESETLFTAFVRDITHRKQAENNLRKYAAELERSNRELQDFAYVASHDLQEPLRKIQAFGSRLSSRYKSSIDARGQQYISSMENASNRMQQLINDLLDFSRVATKARPFTTVDLNKILQGVISDLEVRIEETGANIICSQTLPAVEADPMQMRQVFQNLIGNGLKFKKPDTTPQIEIRWCFVDEMPATDTESKVGPAIKLSFKDNGIGFDNKYKNKIFQIFQRLHGRQEYTGTGVGLAICRKIAERHGGTIEADGQLGEGATFMIYLPVDKYHSE